MEKKWMKSFESDMSTIINLLNFVTFDKLRIFMVGMAIFLLQQQLSLNDI